MKEGATGETTAADDQQPGPTASDAMGDEGDDRGRGGGPPPGPVVFTQTALPVSAASRLFRLIYWVVWFGVLPIVLASLLVWALTPPSGSDVTGILGTVESWVRAQPVPVGIAFFTFFELAVWAVRHELPLARHAHPPLRAGPCRSSPRGSSSGRARFSTKPPSSFRRTRRR